MRPPFLPGTYSMNQTDLFIGALAILYPLTMAVIAYLIIMRSLKRERYNEEHIVRILMMLGMLVACIFCGVVYVAWGMWR